MNALKYKPDFEIAKKYWQAFWKKEIIDRPCICIRSPQNDKEQKKHPPYMAGADGNYEEACKMFDEWASTTYFAGEAIPFFDISFGPDQFSAFLGAELIMAEDRRTSWVKSFITDWKTAKVELKTDKNSVWNKMLDYIRFAAQFSEGKFLISMLDLHSNMDCLSALRGPQNLCMDLIDYSDDVEKVLKEVRALYKPIYEGLYEAGNMKRGTIGWAPFYCEGKYATVQCDFLALIGPKDARRFAVPALEEEALFLDHCVLHYDGPEALVHFDDIMAISEIDVIQWVPGDGKPPIIKWMDLLKKIQKAGKGLQINCSVDEVKKFHKELKPEGVLYNVDATSIKEADELILWLKNNT